MLTPEQVATLPDDVFEVGGHTVNHPILARCSDAEAAWEIRAGRDWLSEVVGYKPELFAYPNGATGVDYKPCHTAMVRDAGFKAAVTTDWGCANTATAPMTLPRLLPWSRRENRFKAMLLKTAFEARA